MKILKITFLFLFIYTNISAQTPEEIAGRAAEKLELKAYRESVDLFHSIPKKDQKTTWLISRARGHFFLGEYDSAFRILERIPAKDPDYPTALADLAEVSYSLEYFSRSKMFCEKLRSMKPEAFTDRTFNILGLAFFREKAYDSARFYFQKSLELKPEDKVVYYNIGLTFENQKQLDSACTAFRNSARFGDPDAPGKVKELCANHFILPQKPEKYAALTDLAGILNREDTERITAKLNKYEAESSVQIAVVIVPTLGEFTVEDLADKIFREWGIGQKETDNGLLFLIAYNDHKMRIQTGYGMEEFVPDLAAKIILDEDAKPAFRADDYAGGIDKVTDTLIGLSSGQFSPQKYEPFFNMNRSTAYGFSFFLLVILWAQSGRKWFSPKAVSRSLLPNGRSGSLQGIAPTAIGGFIAVVEFFGEDFGLTSNLWLSIVPFSALIFIYCYKGIKDDTQKFSLYEKIDKLLIKDNWSSLETVYLGKSVREKYDAFLERFKNKLKVGKLKDTKNLHDEIAELVANPELFFEKRVDFELHQAVLNYRKKISVFCTDQEIAIELLLLESPVYDKKGENNISPEEQKGLDKLTLFFTKELPLLQAEFEQIDSVLLSKKVWEIVELRAAQEGTGKKIKYRLKKEKNSIFPTDSDALEKARRIRLETETLIKEPGKVYALSAVGNLKVLMEDEKLSKCLKSSIYYKKNRNLFQRECKDVIQKYGSKTAEDLQAEDIKLVQILEQKAAQAAENPGKIFQFDNAFLQSKTKEYRSGGSAWGVYKSKYTAASIKSTQVIFSSLFYSADNQPDNYEKNKQLAHIYTDHISRIVSRYLKVKPKPKPKTSSYSSSSYRSSSSSSSSSSYSSGSSSSSDWGGGDSGGGGASSDW